MVQEQGVHRKKLEVWAVQGGKTVEHWEMVAAGQKRDRELLDLDLYMRNWCQPVGKGSQVGSFGATRL
jgi:hypothetical protein